MKKYHFTFDKIKKNKNLKKFLLKKYKNYSPGKCKVIVVLGGDGFMLQTMKKYYKFKKSFYGINSGSYGFLMNKFSKENTLKNLTKAKKISIFPLLMSVKNKFGILKKSIAVNEISILRQN